jgi:hypothetical protein
MQIANDNEAMTAAMFNAVLEGAGLPYELEPYGFGGWWAMVSTISGDAVEMIQAPDEASAVRKARAWLNRTTRQPVASVVHLEGRRGR